MWLKTDQYDDYQERKAWLEEHFPGRYSIVSFQPFFLRLPNHPPATVTTVQYLDMSFGFEDIDDAVKFKLVWG